LVDLRQFRRKKRRKSSEQRPSSTEEEVEAEKAKGKAKVAEAMERAEGKPNRKAKSLMKNHHQFEGG